jgi:3-hydroxy-9,10-secoandrosta-1,3,5(10)-triene-9,17-dione monooxygenase reductase component
VLGERDEELARRFARRAEDKFAGVALVEGSDPPVLDKAIAHFICTVEERVPGGDHSIFIGKVSHCAATPGCRPLLYFRSAFGTIRDPQAEFLEEAAGWDAGSVGGLGHLHVRPR